MITNSKLNAELILFYMYRVQMLNIYVEKKLGFFFTYEWKNGTFCLAMSFSDYVKIS